MPRGGFRENAGRKPGSANKRAAELVEEALKGGETPLEYMLRVMRDPAVEHPRRDDMSKAAAPYVHAKLQAVEHTGKDGGPVQVNISTADAVVL